MMYTAAPSSWVTQPTSKGMWLYMLACEWLYEYYQLLRCDLKSAWNTKNKALNLLNRIHIVRYLNQYLHIYCRTQLTTSLFSLSLY